MCQPDMSGGLPGTIPGLYQMYLILTHRDRLGDPPGRRGAAGDPGSAGGFAEASAGPLSYRLRQGFPTHSAPWPDGSPRRPQRRLPPILWTEDFGPRGGLRPARLAVPIALRRGTATPRAPCRKPLAKKLGEAVSMSHYQRSLVLAAYSGIGA